MELPVPILSAMPFVALSLAPNRWQFNRPLGGICFYCSFVVAFGFGFDLVLVLGFSAPRFSQLILLVFCPCFLGWKVANSVRSWKSRRDDASRVFESVSQVLQLGSSDPWTDHSSESPPITSPTQQKWSSGVASARRPKYTAHKRPLLWAAEHRVSEESHLNCQLINADSIKINYGCKCLRLTSILWLFVKWILREAKLRSY